MGIASIAGIIVGGLMIGLGTILMVVGIIVGAYEVIKRGEIAKGIGQIVFALVFGGAAIGAGFGAILNFV